MDSCFAIIVAHQHGVTSWLRLALANPNILFFFLRDINLTLGLLPSRIHVIWRDSAVGVGSSKFIGLLKAQTVLRPGVFVLKRFFCQIQCFDWLPLLRSVGVTILKTTARQD